MTDKEKMDATIKKNWIRAQRAKLEEIVYDYETGMINHPTTIARIRQEHEYYYSKRVEGWLSTDYYLMLFDDCVVNEKYVNELQKIREGDLPN